MALPLYDRTLPPLDITLEGAPPPRRPLARRIGRRLRGLIRAHRDDLPLVLLLTTAAGVVHALGMYGSPARFDDEGTYTAYAWAVQHRHALGHYTYWYAHPPLGWLQIAAWNVLTGWLHHPPYAVGGTREFMLLCKLVSVPLLYGLAARVGLRRPGRVLAVALFAFSPLAVYFTRAALLDNIVTPWLLAAFFFAASPRRSLRAATASAVCLAVAVLSKETALLYLPAVLALLVQHSDRRTRRFSLGLFGAWFTLLCAAYPLFALLNNELLTGPGHVSLEWAVRWQLSGRQGSGSIFDPASTAHAVIRSWLDQDAWLPRLALLLVVPGLLIRRTRAVALAFAIQVVQLLRGGYLPYPYVIAMIPFAALTVAGVLDWLWDRGRLPLPARLRQRGAAVQHTPGRRSPGRLGWSAAVAAGCAWLLLSVGHAWSYPLHDLRAVDRDRGKAEALAWVESHVPHSAYLVVDDSFWVDLVQAGFPADHVVWYTKLDVDPAVRIPHRPQWAGIGYVLLDRQDELSVHLQSDGTPSKDTRDLFPTLGAALSHSTPVARYGTGLDAISVRRVDPGSGDPGTAPGLGRPGTP
ncbi:glycosyltransferase family 39 protein [Streptacidiphilus griseoplanus]|uniref:glycosyltransferase family 39 protein n=1 Tax=Peterkaempfera griseoplana TaxID=66896 RepID=UPI0006E1BBA6|nr:glycosyltransferase family 39 protein [Peterkaempfera griseoplana]